MSNEKVLTVPFTANQGSKKIGLISKITNLNSDDWCIVEATKNRSDRILYILFSSQSEAQDYFKRNTAEKVIYNIGNKIVSGIIVKKLDNTEKFVVERGYAMSSFVKIEEIFNSENNEIKYKINLIHDLKKCSSMDEVNNVKDIFEQFLYLL
jgi:predicted hydrocarbon binding protein